MNKKGVGWMAGVLITAIFISSIVLVIVLMGIVSDSKVQPPAVPSVDVKESSLTDTEAGVNVGSGGDNVVDVNMTFELEDYDGNLEEIEIPIGVNFFFPDA